MKKHLKQACVLVLSAAFFFTSPLSVRAEGLTAANFDSVRYANENQDLQCTFGYNHEALWLHYLMFGQREGRAVYDKNGTRGNVSEEMLAPVPQVATPEQIFAATMLQAVNAERAKFGAAPLTLAEDCMHAAAVRANDFKQYQANGQIVANLPHIRPDGTNFISAYQCRRGMRYGENTIFTYFFMDDDFVSFANRSNSAIADTSDGYMRMINPNFRYAGFSFVHLKDVGQSSWYAVLQEFRD